MPDNEWLKILASTSVGFVTGIIADPVKGALQWRINLLRMNRAIMLDCLNLRVQLEVVEHDLAPQQKFWEALSLPAFEHYWEKSRDLFYTNLNLQTLKMQCDVIRYTRTSVLRGDVTDQDGRTTLRKTLADIQAQRPAHGRLHMRLRGLLLKFFC